MAFSSKLYKKEVIIHDSTPKRVHAAPKGCGKGLDLSLRGLEGYGDEADPFPSELLVDESEWQARIEESEEKKNRVSDLINYKKLDHKDQANTNYCWVNGPTHCAEIKIIQQNQPLTYLSSASVGAPVKNFKNNGGWGLEALQYTKTHGWVPQSKWPNASINRKYFTEENKKLAKKYSQTEWWVIKPRDLKQMASLLLRRNVAAVGYNWWGHEVTAVEMIWLDGTIALRIRNSWKGWGNNGFGVLQGGKMMADDIVAIRSFKAFGVR